MKITALLGALLLILLLGTSTLATAEHGRGNEREHGRGKEQSKGHQKEHGRPSREQNAQRERGNRPDHMRDTAWHEREQHGRPHDVWQMHRAHDWKHDHRSWRERGGYHGYRIPRDRFRAHFGRGHWFRVHSVPVIVVEGRPRFQYAGFWFTMVDPWPEYWAANWYETDDVYVDYVNDGYYLCNRRHPGVSVAVNVSF